MARKTIFDIYDELHSKDEKEKEFIPVNEVVKEVSEEVKAVEEVKQIETPKEQPKIDLETINQNNTLQSVINEERGE